MTSENRPSILYDLDGTLVHSSPDLIHALNYSLEPIGQREFVEADVGHLVGQGALVMINKGLERYGLNPEDHDLDTYLNRFLSHYEENMCANSHIFDGVVETLEHFSKLGFRQAVCTNKRQHFTDIMLRDMNLTDYFDVAVGADRVSNNKPHQDHILETLSFMNGDRTRAIMVGDSINDVKAAKNAGVPVVVVTFGYTDIPPRELGGDHVIDHFSQLVEVAPSFFEEKG